MQNSPEPTAKPLAKLSQPRLHRSVARPRLFNLLDVGRTHAVIWAMGPPGAGKTSLLSSYCTSRKIPSLWLLLDAGDSDPATFFHYLKRAALSSWTQAQSLPDFTPEYSLDPHTYARRFARELFAALDPPCFVVLDNFQTLLPGSLLHQLVACVLEEIPNGINVAIISRSTPSGEFARLIAAQDLTIIDRNDLCFDEAETRALLGLWGVFDEVDVRRLHQQSSGWAAGLVLAARAVGKARPPDGRQFEDDEILFEYFLSEVFGELPSFTQHVLLATASLPFVSAPQAVELTSDTQAAAVLENLYRQQLFIDRTSETPSTYRFHALFRSFLRKLWMQQWSTEARREHLGRVAQVLNRDGFPGEAIEQYLAAEAWPQAIALISQQAPILLKEGRNGMLLQWVAAVPASHAQSDAWFQVWCGAAGLISQPVTSRAHLERAFHAFKAIGDPIGQVACCSLVLQSYLAEQSDFSPVERWTPELTRLLADQRLALPPPVETLLFAGAPSILIRDPMDPLLRVLLTRFDSFMQQAHSPHDRAMAAWFAVVTHSCHGDPREAERIVALLGISVEEQASAPAARIVHLLLASYMSTFAGDFQTAAKLVDDGLRLTDESGVHVWDFSLYAGGVYAAHDAGDLSRLQDLVARMEERKIPPAPLDLALMQYLQLYVAVLRGDYGSVALLGEKLMHVFERAGARFQSSLVQIALARAHVQCGQHARARQLLIEAQKKPAFGALHFVADAVRSDSLLQTGEDSEALDCLRRMMSLGAKFGLVNVPGFWDPKVMSKLCALALEHDIEPEYVVGLIRARDLAPPSPQVPHWPWRLRVYTLGEFVVQLDGAALVGERKGPKRVLGLLKALIAYGGRAVPEQSLIDALWPDSEGDAGHEAFKITLLRLRRLLGVKDAIEVHEGRIGLNLRRCWVDALSFDALGRTGQEAQAAQLERGLALYRGSFLPQEAGEGWTVAARERLRGKFLHLVAGAGARLEAQGSFEQAIALYLRGLDADELTEEFYQGLMRCYLALGRAAEGMSAFRRLRQVLSVTLGMAPSAQSMRLAEALRGGSGVA